MRCGKVLVLGGRSCTAEVFSSSGTPLSRTERPEQLAGLSRKTLVIYLHSCAGFISGARNIVWLFTVISTGDWSGGASSRFSVPC